MTEQMEFSIKKGVVILQWPIDIEPECLALAKEAIDLQMRSVGRRAVKRRDAELEYASWFPPVCL